MDHNESLVYETPKLPIEVALLEGYFDCAIQLLAGGCKIPANIHQLLMKAETLFNDDTLGIQQVKDVISTPRTLMCLVTSFIRNVLGQNKMYSVQGYNDVISKLPGLNDKTKELLYAETVYEMLDNT